MNRLIAQLKMQKKINKMTFIYGVMMIGLSLVMLLGIAANTVFQSFIHSNNMRYNEISMVTFFGVFYLSYIPFFSASTLSQSLQMAVSMGSTRKSFHLGSVIFIILSDLFMSVALILLLTFERFIYKIVGLLQSIEVCNIIKFGSLNFKVGGTIFLTYFSILMALSGLFYFIACMGMAIFKGKLVILLVGLFFMVSYVGAIFTPLKVYLENFLLDNIGLTLYLKLFLVGISGLVLSWPFIEKLDITRLSYK